MCVLSLLTFVYKGKRGSDTIETQEKTSNENKFCGTVENKQKTTEMMDK